MRIGKIGVAVIGLVPFNVYGECTPTPDCASIGYTETSCEGDYLACPFDSTKLKCIPCDSSYRYNCSGDNITGGTGSACGGKYVSCTCSSTDYIFYNGLCICDTSCKVGAIYYSDKTCSACLNTNKTPIGIVVKDNELIISHVISTDVKWANHLEDMSLPNYESIADAKSDFNGKDNTVKIVARFGENEDTTKYAGVFCYKFSTESTNVGDWYLPAAGELYSYVYGNWSKLSNTWVNKLAWDTSFFYDFWSSSEKSSSYAWFVPSNSGYVNSNFKGITKPVSCFLAID